MNFQANALDEHEFTAQILSMPICTAPSRGHRTESGRASCPACGRYGRSSYGGYTSSYASSSYQSAPVSEHSAAPGGRKSRARWSKPGSSVLYSPTELRELEPVRRKIETLAAVNPSLKDVFLCHAWNDRKGVAKDLYDLLQSRGVQVWFSEKEIGLGVPFMRAIDKGLAASRVGVVLVTPAMLDTLPKEGVADKELSALLQRDRLVAIVHNTTYEDLRKVSPLLASRNGLNTLEESLAEVADKIADFAKP